MNKLVQEAFAAQPAFDVAPKGDCFRWTIQKVRDDNLFMDDRGAVVHGMVAPLGGTKKFWHAWVELAGKVFDWQNSAIGNYPKGMDKTKFYQVMRPSKIRRYTPEDAMILSVRNRHYGPWEKSKGDQTSVEHKGRGKAMNSKVHQEIIAVLKAHGRPDLAKAMSQAVATGNPGRSGRS